MNYSNIKLSVKQTKLTRGFQKATVQTPELLNHKR